MRRARKPRQERPLPTCRYHDALKRRSKHFQTSKTILRSTKIKQQILWGRPVRRRLKKREAEVRRRTQAKRAQQVESESKRTRAGVQTRPRARHAQRMSSQRRPARLSQSQSFAVIDHHDEVSSALCKYSCGDCCRRARRARSRAVRVLLPSCAWPCAASLVACPGDKNVRA